MTQARLQLRTGESFPGESVGAPFSVTGEVVFNTGMVGYPEGLTDPSYHGQILVFAYPLIGNYGVPAPRMIRGLPENFESGAVQPRGVITGAMSMYHSHWTSGSSLADWLRREGIPALTRVDTRGLVKTLRTRGTMNGVLETGVDPPREYLPDSLESPLASRVSVTGTEEYVRGSIRVVAVDCGIKNTIIRRLLDRDITVIRVPWDHDFSRIPAHGYLLSNGPGDPRYCRATIEHTARAMARKKPILGICLGSQILALAAGADTYKLPYGHRGHNQPCRETGTRRCYITSQNHGYAVDAASLPEDWREWFVNLNDGTNEGIIHVSKPFFGAQFHPEASPGPEDTEFLFDMFIRAMQ